MRTLVIKPNEAAADNLLPNEILTVTGNALVEISGVGKVSVTTSQIFGPYSNTLTVTISAFGLTTSVFSPHIYEDGPNSSDLAPVYTQTNDSGATVLVDSAGNILVRPVVAYTWAGKPAAASNTGITIRITDVGGTAGSLWISDGAYWKPVGGSVILAQSGVAITAPDTSVDEPLASVIIPAGIMGTNGSLRITSSYSCGVQTANVKTMRVRFGGASGDIMGSYAMANFRSGRWLTEIHNQGQANAQNSGHVNFFGSFGGNLNPHTTGAQDTSGNVELQFSCLKTTAAIAELVKLERYIVELLHP